MSEMLSVLFVLSMYSYNILFISFAEIFLQNNFVFVLYFPYFPISFKCYFINLVFTEFNFRLKLDEII